MNREEILQRSRNENSNMDEWEQRIVTRAGFWATFVGGLMCSLVIILNIFLGDGVSFSTWAVYLSLTGTMLLVKYPALKKKHELVFGVLKLALAAVFMVMYIVRLVG